jgi:phospholipid transport system substrate-binding protein
MEAASSRLIGLWRWLFGTGIMLLIAGSAAATPVPGSPVQGPVEVLQSMTDTLVEIARQDPEVVHDIPRLREIADDVVLTRVDFEGLSRWVLGKYWRTATPQQRAAFITEFREMLLGTYLRSVSTYEDNAVRFMPLRNSGHEDRVIVNAEVDQTDGPTVNVSFRMRRVGDQWLIYDVAVEGISLVATHRTSFSREIRSSGMDSLIARLRVQNIRNSEQEAKLLSVDSE